MLEIKKDELHKINSKPFGILLFYANGCQHCEKIKPIFAQYAEKYPEIQFCQIEINEGLEYYNKFAEMEQEIKFEPILDQNNEPKKDENGNVIMNIVPQFNEDGTPKMVRKYAVPAFYVHHTEAIAENNEYGFIGGFNGALEDELRTVCDQIMAFDNQNIQPNEVNQ